MSVNNLIAICPCGINAEWQFTLRGFNFFDCKKCTLRFVSPRYLAADIYDNDYFQGASHGFGFTNYEDDKIASRAYLIKFLKWIKKYSNKSKIKLLDVGAANGYFVKLANDYGFNASGIEISNSAVEWAKKLDRPVSQGTLETMEGDNRYEVITALDVLEHVPEPLNFLVTARTRITDDGILLLNVPNLGSIFSKISGEKWHAYLPPEHWIYFNKNSINKMLNMAGFEVIVSKVISKSFTFGYVYLTIANSPQIPKAIRVMFKALNNIFPIGGIKLRIYLPLFDNLTVIAKPIKEIKPQEI
jgi:2-polyprenyl-3-methyl-5-hydroxy-6-metoxy-1,4-benzoquinol methylase